MNVSESMGSSSGNEPLPDAGRIMYAFAASLAGYPRQDARAPMDHRAPTRPTVTGGYLERPAPSGLADVIEIILDKGIVIDAYVRVSVVGIELLTMDARIVIASVDTYLRFAEATNRLDLWPEGGKGLPRSWRISRAR